MSRLLAGALLTTSVAVLAAQTGGACNRECLIGVTEAYLSAMVARDPARAPVTAGVRFTQNTRPMTLGQGVWESIKGVRGYKLFVTDPTTGQVALYTVVDGAERPGLLALRLKVDGQRMSEIESVSVGIGQTGFGSVDSLVTVDPVWTAVLAPVHRRPRAAMVDIANRYFETLEKNLVDHVPFAPDCLRVENGMITAGRAGAPGLAGLGCRENVNHPMWNYITQIAPRRHLVVDEERGLVSGMYMFRHGGTEPTYTLPGGEVVKHSEAMLRRQAGALQNRRRPYPPDRGRDGRRARSRRLIRVVKPANACEPLTSRGRWRTFAAVPSRRHASSCFCLRRSAASPSCARCSASMA